MLLQALPNPPRRFFPLLINTNERRTSLNRVFSRLIAASTTPAMGIANAALRKASADEKRLYDGSWVLDIKPTFEGISSADSRSAIRLHLRVIRNRVFGSLQESFDRPVATLRGYVSPSGILEAQCSGYRIVGRVDSHAGELKIFHESGGQFIASAKRATC